MAMAPFPFWPVGFSAETDRVCASLNSGSDPRPPGHQWPDSVLPELGDSASESAVAAMLTLCQLRTIAVPAITPTRPTAAKVRKPVKRLEQFIGHVLHAW